MNDYDKIQLKIFSLMETAEAQQAALTHLIETLKAEREELPKALKAALANEMRQSLSAVADTADEAERKLKKAVAWLSWQWATIALLSTTGLVLGVWLAAAGAVKWQTNDLRDLREAITEEQAVLAKLETKGGRAKLATCGNPGQASRLCIKIDKSAGDFVNGFYVIHGY